MKFPTQVILKTLRRLMAGSESDFTFYKTESLLLTEMESTDLYIHIPFCKNKCPYCPYNTVPYEEALIPDFFEALRNELNLYAARFPALTIKSLYIGGGTPTTVFEYLETFLEDLRKTWNVKGRIAIETNPEEITPQLSARMKKAGISMVSLGVQSYQNELLDFIGRKYQSDLIDEKVKILVNEGFETVNLDLIFAIGEQSVESLDYDLEKAINSGANQITAYPLFVFPYSSVGTFRKIMNVRMPKLGRRRTLYRHLYKKMIENNYKMVSVWGFSRDNAPKYSSVTRDTFIGLGPGAASCMESGFYFNTFDLQSYISKTRKAQFPTALRMAVPEKLSKLYWLYWRFYETVISESIFKEKFSGSYTVMLIIKILRITGMLSRKDGAYFLSERGSFWIHLLQNHYILNYIDKVWTRCMREPFPEKIEL